MEKRLKKTILPLRKAAFLKRVIIEIEERRSIAPKVLNRLRKLFLKKKFSGIQKCCYEVVIALGMSGNTELRALASEFNAILNNACR